MTNIIRKGLDAYESRADARDERLVKIVRDRVESLSDRSTLKLYILILGGINLLVWLTVVFFPHDVYDAFSQVSEINDRIVAIIIAAFWGLGMWLTYSLCRWRVPDLEDPEVYPGVMAAYAHQQGLYRKFRIWVFAVAGGVLNLLALVAVGSWRLGGWAAG